MISAKEAYNMAAPKLDEYRKFLDTVIRKAADMGIPPLLFGSTLMICGCITNPNWKIWMPNDACVNCVILVIISDSFIEKVSL